MPTLAVFHLFYGVSLISKTKQKLKMFHKYK